MYTKVHIDMILYYKCGFIVLIVSMFLFFKNGNGDMSRALSLLYIVSL